VSLAQAILIAPRRPPSTPGREAPAQPLLPFGESVRFGVRALPAAPAPHLRSDETELQVELFSPGDMLAAQLRGPIAATISILQRAQCLTRAERIEAMFTTLVRQEIALRDAPLGEASDGVVHLVPPAKHPLLARDFSCFVRRDQVLFDVAERLRLRGHCRVGDIVALRTKDLYEAGLNRAEIHQLRRTLVGVGLDISMDSRSWKQRG
jgi:hypothetical protein